MHYRIMACTFRWKSKKQRMQPAYIFKERFAMNLLKNVSHCNLSMACSCVCRGLLRNSYRALTSDLHMIKMFSAMDFFFLLSLVRRRFFPFIFIFFLNFSFRKFRIVVCVPNKKKEKHLINLRLLFSEWGKRLIKIC